MKMVVCGFVNVTVIPKNWVIGGSVVQWLGRRTCDSMVVSWIPGHHTINHQANSASYPLWDGKWVPANVCWCAAAGSKGRMAHNTKELSNWWLCSPVVRASDLRLNGRELHAWLTVLLRSDSGILHIKLIWIEFHSWINVWVAGRTVWSLVNTCHSERCRGEHIHEMSCVQRLQLQR